MRIGSIQTPKVITSDMSKRVKYPNRTVYFALQTGITNEKAHALLVEHDRVRRLQGYGVFVGDEYMTVTPIKHFKEEFNITC